MPRPKSEEAGVRIHIRLTKKQYARLCKQAEGGGYSISETLRRAVDNYLAYAEARRL